MDGKERNRLNGRIHIGEAPPREPEDRHEAENENRDCEIEVRCGRANGSAQQQHCDADPSDEYARRPEFPHVSILADGTLPWLC